MKLGNQYTQLIRKKIILPNLLVVVFHKDKTYAWNTWRTIRPNPISNREPVGKKNASLRTCSSV
jgi:hypothetical protein